MWSRAYSIFNSISVQNVSKTDLRTQQFSNFWVSGLLYILKFWGHQRLCLCALQLLMFIVLETKDDRFLNTRISKLISNYLTEQWHHCLSFNLWKMPPYTCKWDLSMMRMILTSRIPWKSLRNTRLPGPHFVNFCTQTWKTWI